MSDRGSATTDKDVKLTRKDFVSDQEVRWCPGCGDYSILAQVQRVLPELGVPRHKICFISGIGCSSRLPYYVNSYGMHSIHGRAPTFATGLKITRPDLNVWVITGDGDGLSIGGNHLLHVMRRNVDLTIVLFNNRIYGLTKGQYSPTSEFGKKTKSTPLGSVDRPIRPLSVAVAADCSFIARSIDTDTKHMQEVLLRAAQHRGTSFVEVYQNCNVFNDKAFAGFAEKSVRPERTVVLEHGKPLVYGADQKKGIRLNGLSPEVVDLNEKGAEADLLVHDESIENPVVPILLDGMTYPDFPVPVGVFRAIKRPNYELLMREQIDREQEKRGQGELEQLFRQGDVWTVSDEDAAAADGSAN